VSTSRSRIDVLSLVFVAAVLVVVAHLFYVMVGNHEVWAARSHENRWAFRSVPSLRGAIRDRTGRVLVHDSPTMQVSLYYLRFRLRHPVGAAVHGATIWGRQHPGGELTSYDYAPGLLGPEAAARDLLAMPVAMLRRGVLAKAVSGPLATAVTTVMAGTSGIPRRQVYKALRAAAEERPATACGDVLADFTSAELLREYEALLGHLWWFDEQIAPHNGGAGSKRLLQWLEDLRIASLTGRRVTWTENRDGVEVTREGDPKENIAWPVANDVPFDFAAGLRVGAFSHPGLVVRPALRRQCVAPPGSALHALLGRVQDLGRLRSDWRNFDTYAAREMPSDWLDEIVPVHAAVSAEERLRMQRNARRRFESLALQFERGGWTGIERAFDERLSGRIGMRLVERDSKQREQWMWSSLRVKSGDDVIITIDSELQELAERLVVAAQARTMVLHTDPADQQRVKAALAVIDAGTGDVLAFAGAPVAGPSARQVPGVLWFSNGSLGSVVKPFVLIEQLRSEAQGRPHLALAALEACSGRFRYAGVELGCGHAHWDEGTDPIAALAKSCNSFYYQVAVGLEPAGVDRALKRFGLLPAAVGDEFAACWQPHVAGFPWASPRLVDASIAPRRAIGYGIAASPLAVARAYAGLATGQLPTLGLLAGQARPVVSLADLQAELEVVREGLAGCVEVGTARRITGLADFRVRGKTGTAEVGARDKENNAWFAGYLPWTSRGGVQLCFCSVIYWVPDGTHGAEAAGGIVSDLLAGMNADASLRGRYVTPGGGK